MRRLTPQERALWAHVAASVKPLPGRTTPPPPTLPPSASPPPPAPPPPTASLPTASLSTPAATRQAKLPPPRPTPLNATLDGRWDRQIARGRLQPDSTIDLHGHTLADAHRRLAAAIYSASDARVLLVITGKGRPDRPGRIRAELVHWLEQPAMRAGIASVRPAHPRHGGAGAFYIILKRPR